MWVQSGSSNFVFKTIAGSQHNHILLSDFIHIWEDTFDNPSLLDRFKAENPNFEASDAALMKKISSLFTEVGKTVTVTCRIEGNCNYVTFSANANNFAYGLELPLRLSTSHRLYEELTLRLMGMLKCYEAREQRLVKIIESKDIEIEEYRQENVEIKRRGIITATFNYKAFDEDSVQNMVPLNRNNPATCIGDEVLAKLSLISMDVSKDDSNEGERNIEEMVKNPKVQRMLSKDDLGCTYISNEEIKAEIPETWSHAAKKKKSSNKTFRLKV